MRIFQILWPAGEFLILTMSPEQPAVMGKYHRSGGQIYLLGCDHDSCICFFILSKFSVTEGHPDLLLFLLLPLPTLLNLWIEGSSKERQFTFTVQRDEYIKMEWKRVRACPKTLGFLHNTHSPHSSMWLEVRTCKHKGRKAVVRKQI